MPVAVESGHCSEPGSRLKYLRAADRGYGESVVKKKTRYSLGHLLRTLLCLVLTLHFQFWAGGCGTAGLVGLDGWVQFPLGAGDPVKTALKASGFESAGSIAVQPSERRFRIETVDGQRVISGSYDIVNNQAEVASIEFARGSLFVRFQFDANKHVTQITSATGAAWSPVLDESALFGGFNALGVDAYLGANLALVNTVRRSIDGGAAAPSGGGSFPVGSGSGGGSSGGSGGLPSSQAGLNGKEILSAQLIPGDLSGIMGTLGLLIGAEAAIAAWPALLFVFQAAVGVNLLLGMLGMAPAPATQTAPAAATITGDATLRVNNNLTNGVPIWFVVLVQDLERGFAGGNLLGEEAIPAGESRDFAVPPGTRDINLIIPEGRDCFMIFRKFGVELPSRGVTELSVNDDDVGELHPSDCSGA